MIKYLKKNFYFFLLLISILLFFNKVIFFNLLPIPADTIVGLYYPFRDIYASTNPNGIPFKNFLVTDPVRQTFPWKHLVINIEKNLQLPLWNPYNFAGTPLLANLQSGPFYFLNVLFFMFPFSLAWSLLIILQPILAGCFMYLYLKNLDLKKEAAFLGSIAFSLGGFSTAWLEWGNVLHVALWLPLILLSVDKISSFVGNKKDTKNLLIWASIFLFSLVSSFFAGHLQIFFYIFIFAFVYLTFRGFGNKFIKKFAFLFFGIYALFFLITLIQWYPTLQFILLSARNADLVGYTAPGWFIPFEHLIQFIIPDFFGNPSTLNYFGVWNYGEFAGYVGLLPFVFAIYAVIAKREKTSLFFLAAIVISLVFAVASPVSKLPFILNLPFISTSQPTRLIFIINFSLAVLCAFGVDRYSREKKGIIYLLMILSALFIGLWIFVLFGSFGIFSQENLAVARSNLFLPTLLFMSIFVVFAVLRFLYKSKNKLFYQLLFGVLIVVTLFDILRFGWKFEPFSKKEYLFPSTSGIEFLQKQKGIFRVATTDSQILPPNFSIMYGLQTADGYDPLYTKRYGEFAAAYSRGRPDISGPFGFNRIITLQDVKSRMADLLGIRYVLSFGDPVDTKLVKVFSDGKTQIYENTQALERAFFVSSTIAVKNKDEAIIEVMNVNNPLNQVAVVENVDIKKFSRTWVKGNVKINSYSENSVVLETESEEEGFLVLTDSYYPIWRAKIDGKEHEIILTNYTFRGVVVPEGKHTVEFYAVFDL